MGKYSSQLQTCSLAALGWEGRVKNTGNIASSTQPRAAVLHSRKLAYSSIVFRAVGLLGLVLAGVGCQREGVFIQGEVLAPLRQVPTMAILAPAELAKEDYLYDGEKNRYKPFKQLFCAGWINAERFTDLNRRFLLQGQLFQKVLASKPVGPCEMYLSLRPRITVKQYIRPTIAGAMLSVGTGLLYNILGGPEAYRQVECQIEVELLGPGGRHITTYISTRKSAERAVADRPWQLGPLVSYAYTKAMEDIANQISVDNDMLMRALTADMASKGVVPLASSAVRINVNTPKGVVIRRQNTLISGQIVGMNGPATLSWYLNGSKGGNVALKDTTAESVKEFSLRVPFSKGIEKVTLALHSQAAGGAVSELARTEMAYLCIPRDAMPLPEVRQRWAVIIGVSDYANGGSRFPDLKYAARDAEAFRQFVLSPRSGGFDEDRVLCLLDEKATNKNIRHALFEFLAKAGKDDLVVIFFSGHGMPQAGGENFFMLCHDTHPDRLASTAFPMWDIDTALRRFIKARRVVVFADACHAGVIASQPGTKGGSNPVHQYLQQLALAEPGRLILTASEAREVSFESEKFGDGHGVFTYFLLKGLEGQADRDKNGLVTAGEIVEYVRSEVISATKDKQHPNPSGQYDRNLPLAVVGNN